MELTKAMKASDNETKVTSQAPQKVGRKGTAGKMMSFQITARNLHGRFRKERKGKRLVVEVLTIGDIQIAPIVSTSTTKRSDVDHTELPANTPHLPFLRLSIR